VIGSKQPDWCAIDLSQSAPPNALVQQLQSSQVDLGKFAKFSVVHNGEGSVFSKDHIRPPRLEFRRAE
jgi:hypothetical protein